MLEVGRPSAVHSPGVLSRPMVVSFVMTSVLMLLVCRLETTSRLTWHELLVFAPLCLLLAGLVHAAAVWTAGNIVEVQGPALRRLICEIWIPVVWVPVLMIMGMAQSLWVSVLLPVTVWLTAALVRQWKARADEFPSPERLFEGNLQSLFRVPPEAAAIHTILPTMVISLAVQLGLIAAARRMDWLAAAFFAMACVVRLPWMSRPRMRFDGRAASVVSSVALLLMVLGLTTFLKVGPGALALARLLAMQRVTEIAAAAKAPQVKGPGYSGIVLLQPPRLHEIVAPVPLSATLGMGKPRVIVFDGAYWYFKAPDNEPEPNAPRVQGDPIRNHIFSTNARPLLMEAHQPLGQPVAMSCCHALRVTVKNAETSPGAIVLEMVLVDHGGKETKEVSLGPQLLASSTVSPMPSTREPVEETLTFHLPAAAKGRMFDEIAVRITTDARHARAGVKVAIESFALEP